MCIRDRPLNVSREILQEHQLVDTIKKSITKKVLDALVKLKNKSLDSYQEFWKEYGLVIKEGPAEDYENRELLASLMLFASSTNKEHDVSQTLDDYISRMPESQDKIYFCVADTFEAAINSPHIEGHKANNTEVLMLTDRIDEWLMSSLMEYKGKELVNVAKDDLQESEKPKVSESDQDLSLIHI